MIGAEATAAKLHGRPDDRETGKLLKCIAISGFSGEIPAAV
jgi:hypothetical protein